MFFTRLSRASTIDGLTRGIGPQSSFDASKHQHMSDFFWSSLVDGKLRNSRADYDDDEHHHTVVSEVGDDEDGEGFGDVSSAFEGVREAENVDTDDGDEDVGKDLELGGKKGDFEWTSGIVSLGTMNLLLNYLLTSSNPNLENGENGSEKMESLSTDDYEIGYESIWMKIVDRISILKDRWSLVMGRSENGFWCCGGYGNWIKEGGRREEVGVDSPISGGTD
ncbi:hypothetical protein L6452_39179 [Arctium lappa]|uniref:Uncharacterized protein n=1 Tax=Arctium lappa TaxID=4217 RepID=A0ACB8XSR2_ARCLA|nr:hypothetical protein L6452_39179 [Arctium lappa]